MLRPFCDWRSLGYMRPGNNAPQQIYTNMYAHPEWPKFSQVMRQAGVGPLKINQAWGLMMSGLATQERLFLQGRKGEKNPEYAALAELLGEELKLRQGTSLALWSGGFAVSEYAHKKGHTSLEFTKAGKAIDQLELHKNWSLQAPLWNALSVAFVQHASPDVHIYIRAWDPDSVLIRQEVPGLRHLQALYRQIRMHWHALYTDESNVTKEIAHDGRLVDEAEFATRDLCVAALCKYLLYINEDPKNRAAKEMKEQLNLGAWPMQHWTSLARGHWKESGF